jgi:hypothetical protein
MTIVSLQYVSRLLVISGGICGLWGASKMANQYTDTVRSPIDLVAVLANAIFRRNAAKATSRLAEVGEEDKVATLRGLALIFGGFFLQAIGGLIDLFTFR